jgi:hypothetical protein
VIKNPSRTAIKVFLVKYDLKEMPNGSKTLVRQKSYESGSPTTPSLSKERLRYAIQLLFHNNSKNKLHLTNMRVVFSPRNSDNEKVRVVTQSPQSEYISVPSPQSEYISVPSPQSEYISVRPNAYLENQGR